MSLAGTGFKVLTEFKFEVGSAVSSGRTLQDEIGRISDAAAQAEDQIIRLGSSMFAQFGLGYLSVGTMIFKAFGASEKFYQSQLKISNIFLSNRMFQGPMAFQDSMTAAADALERMKGITREFSLPAEEFAAFATSIGTALTVKGLDDSSMSKSIDIARAFMKSAPVLLPGQDPMQSQSQLIGAISGRADLGGTLVQRLLDETDVMKPFSGKGGLSKFNNLKAAERLEKLTKALDQFSSQVDVTKGIANSFTGQLILMKNNLFGMFSIFRRVGDSVNKLVTRILKEANTWILTKGEAVANNFGKMFERIVRDPMKLYNDLKQLQGLRQDSISSGKVLSTMAMFQGVTWFLATATKYVPQLQGLSAGASGLAKFAEGLGNFIMPTKGLMKGIGDASIWNIFGRGIKFIRIFALSLGSLLFLFQALTRAAAMAKINNMKWLADNMDRISDLFGRFQLALSAIFAPLTMAIDGTARWLAVIFDMTITGEQTLGFLEALVKVLEILGKIVVGTLSAISAAMAGLMSLANAFGGEAKLGDTGAFDRLKEDTKAGWGMVWDKYYDKEDPTNKRPTNKKPDINLGKVEIINQFKEQLEPDRIAFTLKEQLIKAAINPKSARGRTFSAGSMSP